jgi:hypothetical protein
VTFTSAISVSVFNFLPSFSGAGLPTGPEGCD